MKGEPCGPYPAQQQLLEDWMRSKAIVQCPACGHDKWGFDEAAYIRERSLRKANRTLPKAVGW